ncbi:hypothetical protein MRB53_009227 [Persea americana]|uniref:Uncharacterized protein n=1 Tax=Persea americana TaxID=3435 RepID=A0ACC2LNK6_PERAE|nr:hypothetical protein MRB53_009227 [Persea americana]
MDYLQISHLNRPLTPPIHAVTTSSGIGSSTGFSNEIPKPGEEAANQSLKNELLGFIKKGDWEAVLCKYRKCKDTVQTAKITRSNETALHIAISYSRIDIVEELLKIIDAHVIREMTDHRKENPLHLAALLGQTKTCKLLVDKDPELIGARNIDGETPLFKAARHGKKGAFYALHPKCHIAGSDIKHEIRHCKRKDGNTILHVSILEEYFELAFQIINLYPELMVYNNEKGQTALHLLALNPAAFKSWRDLGLLDDFIYRCEL